MPRWAALIPKAFSVPLDEISMVTAIKGVIRHKALRSLTNRLEITQDDRYVNLNVLETEQFSETYRHDQPFAASTWTVNHGLGFAPSLKTYGPGGREMLGEVIHNGLNQSYVYFDSPVSGFAVCS